MIVGRLHHLRLGCGEPLQNRWVLQARWQQQRNADVLRHALDPGAGEPAAPDQGGHTRPGKGNRN